MTITLTHDLEEMVNEKVNGGAYKTADEVIRASLRLLQAREEGLEALRNEILLGVAQSRRADSQRVTPTKNLNRSRPGLSNARIDPPEPKR